MSRSLQRRPGTREPRRRFLIYCEGRNTECIYLAGVKQLLRATNVSIKVGSGSGEPVGLVQQAVQHQKRAHRCPEDGYEAYDEVWCVFDTEWPNPHPALDRALQIAKKARINCAITNPCFELWLIWHVMDWHRAISTESACQKALDTIPGYHAKRKLFIFDDISAGIPAARRRAKQSDRRHGPETPVARRNPWSSMWELLDRLGVPETGD